MSSIVVNPKDQKELKFLSQLFKKLGINAKILTDEAAEDLGLTMLMKNAKPTELADPDEVMSKLKR